VNDTARVGELESALIERARALADEYITRGRRNAEHIMDEANSRLRLREEREVLAAKAEADRVFRRRVQAAELTFQEELDQLRWTLAQTVLDQLDFRLEALVHDRGAYDPVLRALIAEAAAAIPGNELLVRLSRSDHERFKDRWNEFAAGIAAGKRLLLDPDPVDAVGGAVARTPDDRVQVDNTFEGRKERFEEEILQQVMDALFSSAGPMGVIFNG